MPAMDLSNLRAIDVHTRVHRSVRADQAEAADGKEAMGAYFGIGSMPHYTVPRPASFRDAEPEGAGNRLYEMQARSWR